MGAGYDFSALLAKAEAAATEAAERVNATLPPENMRGFDCGFAWVRVNPARGPFVNWCRAEAGKATDSAERRRYGARAWDRGWEFWCTGFASTQSISVHQAAAVAFADVLMGAGLVASVGSRLD